MQLKFKIWVESDDEMFLGNGRVNLLQAIGEHGSISAAAKHIGLSYKKAWEQVDHMNALSPEPLVERSTGGAGGGGTLLTEQGEKLVQEFSRMRGLLEEKINNSSTLFT